MPNAPTASQLGPLELPTVKLLDFGIAKQMTAAPDETQTVDGVVVGTAAYMSPEQATGKSVDARSDIFSFGAVVYELLSGRRAFDGGSTAEVLSAVLRDTPQPLHASPALARLVTKCLEKEPDRRYQSTSDVVNELEKRANPPLALPSSSRRAWQAGAALVGVAVLFIVGAIGFNVGGWRDRLSGTQTTLPIQSLAVFPLDNLSGAAGQEYFADGMTDALINELARIPALKVISRTSVMPYKNARKPLKQIAAELAVDGVIEGSVLQEGDQIRISVKLIHGSTDRHVWSDSYQRELRSVLALQNDVARAVAREIKVTLTPQDEKRLASARDVNQEAYDVYLRGLQYLDQRTEEGQKKGIESLERAVLLDPRFAPAHARLALCTRPSSWVVGSNPASTIPRRRRPPSRRWNSTTPFRLRTSHSPPRRWRRLELARRRASFRKIDFPQPEQRPGP